jgi:hypothetical protein
MLGIHSLLCLPFPFSCAVPRDVDHLNLARRVGEMTYNH